MNPNKECKCYYGYILITLCTIIMAQDHVGVCGRQHKRNNVYLRDKIIELQCYARCETATITQFDKCLKQCQLELIKAPRRGYCPFNSIFKNMNIPLQGLSCLYNCSYDYDCPEVHKCCQSTCGSVCIEPWGVRDDSLLPPIPKIEEYTLIKYEQKVEINCTINSLQTNSTYFFHVESRHHVGHSLRPRKFGAWQYQPVDKIAELHDYNSKLFSTKVGFHLRAVHWYQVRVAAINAYGFRGYSEPSQAFTLPNHPKPPKPPADLKVVSSHFDGKHYTVKIVWCTSKSNLPIEKYKIIWALYVKTKDESFISNETYVKERHQYEISNLLPDSSYYIQVQAMSINGRRRLKSEPRFILYNTTTAPTHAYKPLKCGKEPQHIIRGFSANQLTAADGKSSSMITSSHKKLLQRNDPSSVTSVVNSKNNSNNNNNNNDNNNNNNDNNNNNNNNNNHNNNNNNNNNSTYNVQLTTNAFDIKFCLNRKNDLIVIISGFPTRKGKIYELCPQETNCEEYNAIRAKKGPLVFNKLSCNITYALKPLTEIGGHSMKGITFVTPTREYIRKDCPKANSKCCKNEIKLLK